MAASQHQDTISTNKQSVEIVKIENAETQDETIWLQRYPLLVSKSPEELAALNKSVLRKLDWRFLPCISLMLLMKLVLRSIVSQKRTC